MTATKARLLPFSPFHALLFSAKDLPSSIHSAHLLSLAGARAYTCTQAANVYNVFAAARVALFFTVSTKEFPRMAKRVTRSADNASLSGDNDEGKRVLGMLPRYTLHLSD